jgi:hypothetical protein
MLGREVTSRAPTWDALKIDLHELKMGAKHIEIQGSATTSAKVNRIKSHRAAIGEEATDCNIGIC